MQGRRNAKRRPGTVMNRTQRAAETTRVDHRPGLRQVLLIVWSVWAFSLWPAGASAEEISQGASAAVAELTLKRASLCEGIKDNSPHDEAAVFSCGIGKTIC